MRCLEAARHGLGLLDRRALGQPQVHQDLGPARIGKELLLHLAHAGRCRARSVSSVATDGDPAVLDAPVHQRAKARVERRVEQLVRLRRSHLAARAQQRRAEVGHEVHRHEPRDQQRGRGDGEDREGVLAGHRLGHADRQETRRGDQRAGQHRHRGDVVGEGGGAHLVVALFELAHHHLDRDDRVVDEQAERDDQRAERDLVQARRPSSTSSRR